MSVCEFARDVNALSLEPVGLDYNLIDYDLIDDGISEPKFTIEKPKRQVSGHNSKSFADIASHASKTFSHGDPSISAHETVHILDGELYNKYAGSSGDRIQPCYCLDDKVFVAKEPKGTLEEIRHRIPSSLRASRYNIYLISQQKYFATRPAYVLEEWAAYINGAKVSVESGTHVRSDDVYATLEMGIYSICVPLVTNTKDEEIRRFIAYQWDRSLKICEEGGWPWKTKEYIEKIKNAPDGSELKSFCRDYFGKEWAKKRMLA